MNKTKTAKNKQNKQNQQQNKIKRTNDNKRQIILPIKELEDVRHFFFVKLIE